MYRCRVLASCASWRRVAAESRLGLVYVCVCVCMSEEKRSHEDKTIYIYEEKRSQENKTNKRTNKNETSFYFFILYKKNFTHALFLLVTTASLSDEQLFRHVSSRPLLCCRPIVFTDIPEQWRNTWRLINLSVLFYPITRGVLILSYTLTPNKRTMALNS